MAVHNIAGAANDRVGFKRVVLARELSATELKQIRVACGSEDIEIEVFATGVYATAILGFAFLAALTMPVPVIAANVLILAGSHTRCSMSLDRVFYLACVTCTQLSIWIYSSSWC